MEEDTKKVVWGMIIVGIAIIVFALLISDVNKDSERQRQKNIQEINECFEKTADKDWCLNKFLR